MPVIRSVDQVWITPPSRRLGIACVDREAKRRWIDAGGRQKRRRQRRVTPGGWVASRLAQTGPDLDERAHRTDQWSIAESDRVRLERLDRTVRQHALPFTIIVITAGSAGSAIAAPTLEQTQLYSKSTSGCRTLALDHWRHPTAQVLRKADVTLSKVELCNNGKYPIFTVHFKYDPRGLTSSYFDPLYARMAAANGHWPFAFVDLDDKVIITISISPGHQLNISYEDYAPSAITAPSQ
jgi:hypothetical protein